MSDTTSDITPPIVLNTTHDLTRFQSGEPALDSWLRQRALNNLELGASRTYVVCPVDSDVVVGFYSLGMGQVLALDVPGSMRRNMPNSSIPECPCIPWQRVFPARYGMCR